MRQYGRLNCYNVSNCPLRTPTLPDSDLSHYHGRSTTAAVGSLRLEPSSAMTVLIKMPCLELGSWLLTCRYSLLYFPAIDMGYLEEAIREMGTELGQSADSE